MRRKNRREINRENAKLAPKQGTSELTIPAGVIPIKLRHPGQSSDLKEVRITVVQAGKTKSGTVKHQVSVRFTNAAKAKITDGDYIMAGVSPETKRLYFWPSEPAKGYKLLTNETTSTTCGFRFFCDDKNYWDGVTGTYDLQRDSMSNLYYIYFGRDRA